MIICSSVAWPLRNSTEDKRCWVSPSQLDGGVCPFDTEKFGGCWKSWIIHWIRIFVRNLRFEKKHWNFYENIQEKFLSFCLVLSSITSIRLQDGESLLQLLHGGWGHHILSSRLVQVWRQLLQIFQCREKLDRCEEDMCRSSGEV